jgi:hypothetical protein
LSYPDQQIKALVTLGPKNYRAGRCHFLSHGQFTGRHALRFIENQNVRLAHGEFTSVNRSVVRNCAQE